MNTENHIDEYIRKEKALKPATFLSTRVMARLEQPEQKHSSLWRTVIIVTSFALVMSTGIGIGSLYKTNDNNVTALNINDNQILNRTFINSLAYE